MGSARVQYELERTLPSLQLAVEHGIFDKEKEIRSITQKRRQFENALVRRHALSEDFHTYLDYEEELEKLLKLRLKRIQATEDVPRSDIHKLQHEFTRHLISIFERSVKRLRDDFTLWQRYINWAKQRNMRGAISRISARALSLFPNNIQLWLSIANHELNVNLNPSTARALLQRGLRLNGVVNRHSIATSSTQRSNKKAKLNNGQSVSAPLRIRPSGDKFEDSPTFNVAENERNAAHLWLEYIRMELVFLERIRRRKIALNIIDSKKATKEVNEEGKNEQTKDDEDEEVSSAVEGDPAAESIAEIAEKETKESQPEADSIILGAIPITAIKSALSLESTVCLPPMTHFGLLISLTRMIDEFPFYGDASELRKRLNKNVEEALQDRFMDHPTAFLYEGILPLLHSTSKTDLEELGEIELKEELESSKLLRKASKLTSTSDLPQARKGGLFEVDLDAKNTTDRNLESDTKAAQDFVLQVFHSALGKISTNIERANRIRSTLELLRSKVLALDIPEDGHFSTQLRLIQKLRSSLEELQVGKEFDEFLVAYSKRILQDAKMRECSGKETQLARLQGQLVGKLWKSVENLQQFVDKAIQSSLQYGKDRRFVHLAADAILKGSQDGILVTPLLQKTWRTVFKAAKGVDDVELWQRWCDSLLAQDDGEKLYSVEITRAIVQDTVGKENVQQFLTARLYDIRKNAKIGKETINWAKRNGFAQAPFLRFVVRKEQTLIENGDFEGEKEQQEFLNLITFTYDLLVELTQSPEDIISYLRFLCLTADAQQSSLELFNKQSQRMNRIDKDGLILLERGWKDILNVVRQDDKEEEEKLDN